MPFRSVRPALNAILLLLLAAPLPALGPVLVTDAKGAAVFDPWRWEGVGQLDTGGMILCPDPDGRHVWSPDPKAPSRLRRLSLKDGRPDGVSVTAQGPVVALEADPDGARLYALAGPVSPAAGVRAEVLWIDTEGATILARQSLIGLPRALRLLPAEEPREAQLLVAAWVPDLKTGMLYALDTALIHVASSQPMPGDPKAILFSPGEGPEAPQGTADRPGEAGTQEKEILLDASGSTPAAGALSSTASAAALSPTATMATARKGASLLSGSFIGQVLDAKTRAPLPGASVQAVNRRGKAYPGRVDGQGAYRIDGLPYGTYQLQAEAVGHQPKRLPEQRLALTSEERVDLKLEPLETEDAK